MIAGPDADATAAHALGSRWLLRFAGLFAAAAAFLARIVAPGLHGNAPERVVVTWDGIAALVSYALALLLVYVAATGIYELARRMGHRPIVRRKP